MVTRILPEIVATALVIFSRFITAARAIWLGAAPEARQRVYFANHTSNGDFVLVWAVLPHRLRQVTRPVSIAAFPAPTAVVCLPNGEVAVSYGLETSRIVRFTPRAGGTKEPDR